MKRILVLFLMLFALSTVVATASTLVKKNINKDVFISKEKTISIVAVVNLEKKASVPFLPDRQSFDFINYNKKLKPFTADTFSNKEVEVQNKDVVWLTNMKSK